MRGFKLQEETIRAIRYAVGTTFFFRYTDWRKFPGFSGINIVSSNRLLGLGGDFTLNTGSFCGAFEIGHRWLLQLGGLYQQDTRELRDPIYYSHALYGPKLFVSLTVVGVWLRLIADDAGVKLVFRWAPRRKVYQWMIWKPAEVAHA